MRRTTRIRIGVTPRNQAAEPSGGLLGRIIGLIVGVALFAVAVFLGAVFIAGFVGLVLIGGLIFTFRLWRMRRQMEQYEREHGDLEGEYRVMREDDYRQ